MTPTASKSSFLPIRASRKKISVELSGRSEKTKRKNKIVNDPKGDFSFHPRLMWLGDRSGAIRSSQETTRSSITMTFQILEGAGIARQCDCSSLSNTPRLMSVIRCFAQMKMFYQDGKGKMFIALRSVVRVSAIVSHKLTMPWVMMLNHSCLKEVIVIAIGLFTVYNMSPPYVRSCL